MDGFILAGGASSRMGVAKENLLLGGRTLLQRAVSTAKAISDSPVRVITRDRSDIVDGFSYIIDQPVPGPNAGVQAPIVGLYTALKTSSAEWVLVLAADLPFVSAELLKLLSDCRTDELDAVVPIQPDGRRQPLCSLYRRVTCLDAVREVLTGDDLSFSALLAKVQVGDVATPKYRYLSGYESMFLNVNTPDDLERARLLA